VKGWQLILFTIFSVNSFAASGLEMQVSAGLTDAQSPRILTDYWSHSVNFNASFGGALNESLSFFVAFTHHYFDYRGDVVAQDEHANASEVLLCVKKRMAWLNHRLLSPYYALGVGFSLLTMPDVYRQEKYDLYPIRPENLLALRQQSTGFTAGFRLGMEFLIIDPSRLFAEAFSAITLDQNNPFIYLGIRCGVLFTI